MIYFGPAGNGNWFYEDGNKDSLQIPKWINGIGLDAYEYQCGRGVKISKEKAQLLGKEAKENNVKLSIHAPYFISLASLEEEKRVNSIKYIMQTLEAAKNMGAGRVVVHPGAVTGRTRKEAIDLACETMKLALVEADLDHLSDIQICPETMGKINQIGNEQEIIQMCKLDERLIPTIDWGHLNARTHGSLVTQQDFENVLELFENELGQEKMKHFHCHFSKIEWTSGGEKKHLTMEDEKFGPDFTLLAKALIKRKLEPVIICESDGVMAEDALKMKKIYYDLL